MNGREPLTRGVFPQNVHEMCWMPFSVARRWGQGRRFTQADRICGDISSSFLSHLLLNNFSKTKNFVK